MFIEAKSIYLIIYFIYRRRPLPLLDPESLLLLPLLPDRTELSLPLDRVDGVLTLLCRGGLELCTREPLSRRGGGVLLTF